MNRCSGCPGHHDGITIERGLPVNISIFGLGYVGTVSAICLAKSGHRVIGVDSNPVKVELINQGTSPIVEPGVDALLKQMISERRLSATTNLTEAVQQSDLSLVCVGTPSSPNGSLNLDQVMRVAEQVGQALRLKSTYHGFIIRSTVLPGTVDKAGALIARESGKTLGHDFGVASNPEFLREGTSLFDFENPPFTAVGASDEKLASMLKEMYVGITAPFFSVKVREAELLKYTCNAFHAVKVTFANEIGAISKKLGIDSHVVMGMFVQDTKLNISPYYLKPGFAFGGSCLPKDVRAITYEAKRLDIAAPLLDSLVPSNEAQIHRVVNWVLGSKRKKVGVLGLSFKKDTDDLRESPIVDVVETLIGKGFDLAIYDANVNIARLIGANKSYIEHEIPHISSLMKESMQEVLDHAEILLISNKAPEFKSVLASLKPNQIVFDLVRITEDAKVSKGAYEGIGW
jgi:GDP-mannose 6-dehydrogenase